MIQEQEMIERLTSFLLCRGVATATHSTNRLVPHLLGTYMLLKHWGNPEEVCIAGLAHTIYGIEGPGSGTLDPMTERYELAMLIGDEAEALVYFYDSCDRNFFFANIQCGDFSRFRDRHTGRVFEPEAQTLDRFLEITFASHLEMLRTQSRRSEHARRWRSFLLAATPRVSAPARDFYRAVFPD